MWYGVELSATTSLPLVLSAGATARHLIGASAMGSVWRGLHNYCLATLLVAASVLFADA